MLRDFCAKEHPCVKETQCAENEKKPLSLKRENLQEKSTEDIHPTRINSYDGVATLKAIHLPELQESNETTVTSVVEGLRRFSLNVDMSPSAEMSQKKSNFLEASVSTDSSLGQDTFPNDFLDLSHFLDTKSRTSTNQKTIHQQDTALYEISSKPASSSTLSSFHCNHSTEKIHCDMDPMQSNHLTKEFSDSVQAVSKLESIIQSAPTPCRDQCRKNDISSKRNQMKSWKKTNSKLTRVESSLIVKNFIKRLEEDAKQRATRFKQLQEKQMLQGVLNITSKNNARGSQGRLGSSCPKSDGQRELKKYQTYDSQTIQRTFAHLIAESERKAQKLREMTLNEKAKRTLEKTLLEIPAVPNKSARRHHVFPRLKNVTRDISRLYDFQKIQEKIFHREQLKRQLEITREAEALAECTFRPKLTSQSRKTLNPSHLSNKSC